MLLVCWLGGLSRLLVLVSGVACVGGWLGERALSGSAARLVQIILVGQQHLRAEGFSAMIFTDDDGDDDRWRGVTYR